MQEIAFFVLGILEDFSLILKIFVLMTIISFVLGHLGKTPLAMILLAIVSIFVLGDFWKFFGGIYLLYMMLSLGIAGILIDFFFVSGMGGGGQHAEQSPVDSGRDLAHRQKAIMERQHAARQAGMQRGMRRGPMG